MKRFVTVDAYIKAQPKVVQARLNKLRATIKAAAPHAEEKISYGMPAFKLNKRILVYFAAWEKHIGLYAMPSANKAFQKELAKYTTAKATIQFPHNKPIPFGLIKKIVLFRVKENFKR